jgi:alcohol dehydrogenase class IV
MYQLIQFKTPSILFGMDTISQIGQEAKKLGAGRVLIVTGPRVKAAGILEKALSFLKGESISGRSRSRTGIPRNLPRPWWKRWPRLPGKEILT